MLIVTVAYSDETCITLALLMHMMRYRTLCETRMRLESIIAQTGEPI
jgi:hypothetical protein